jgi:RimJ/RimL family protein N-acetyltransferase
MPQPPALDAEAWRHEIRTARLRLVPLDAADADDLFPALDDARLHAFTGGAPLSLDALRARYARLATGRSPDGRETWANWVVRLGDGTAVGYLQATIAGGSAELAWVIGTPWQGRGLASEAAAALAAWLRAAGVERLTAHIRPGHAASAAVASASGLHPTGQHDGDGEEVWVSRPPARTP